VNKRTKLEKFKFVYKVTDYGNDIKIIDMKDISDYSLVIVKVKIIISKSPVDIHNFEKELKILEAEIGDDTYGNVIKLIDMKDISDYSLVIVKGKIIISTSPVDMHIFEKEMKKIETEIADDTYGNVIKIIDMKDISDYSLVIAKGKINISTSPVDMHIFEKELKKIETEIADDTYGNVIKIIDMKDISDYSLVIVKGKIIISTSPVDIHIFEKALKKLEAEIGDDTDKFKNQLTYMINVQGTKCLSLNSDSKIVNALQIANVESLFQDNSSATIEATSISCVGKINKFFWCKHCDKKFMPCQGKLQQCTECGMMQLINDIKDTSISVILSLTEPKLEFTIFQDQLNNIVKIYNEENNTNNRLPTLTDTTLAEIILSVSNVKIYYDKNTKIITDIQKL